MNSRVIKLLQSLCGLLLIILLLEWLVIGFSGPPTGKSISAIEDGQSQDTELPELILAEQSVETYIDMVERPLFIKGRKPVVDLNEGNDNLESSKIEDMILVGIYSNEGYLIALFSQQGKDKKYLKKSEGDDISGWLIKEIQADQIILEQAGGQKTVMLRKPKPKTKSKIKAKIKPKPKPGSKPKPASTLESKSKLVADKPKK